MRKKAMNYVSKVTELSTEKVELGIVDDLKNYIESLEGSIKTLEGDFQVFRSLRNRVQSEAENGEQRIKQINQELQRLRQAAKELGIDPNSFAEVKQAERLLNNFKSLTQGKAKLGGLLSL
jgi:uncharacterized protein (DUF3084 family)|tara:strand:- start:311 stop:673 length:363 start_codon:yes stop_codon:yes gene_type:complete